MPDLDALLNFLYIVAFLAAMILPSFQRQRREEARKRAESQRQAQEVPTVEERSPEDVPEPTIRRAASAETDANRASPAAAAPVASPNVVAEPDAAAEPEVAAAAARQVGGVVLTELDETIDLTHLDDAIDVTSLDDGETPPGRLATASEAVARTEGAPRISTSDRAALRQAVIFAELLQPPLSLRPQRVFPPRS
ncbi:MAG: hypothetical protein IPN34_07230 [Planctomycetes bacterium]|nr:hypothetical protein [Planctomycetota bacterium]